MNDAVKKAQDLRTKMMGTLRPDHTFDATKAPAAYDYTDPASWAAWPGRVHKANMVPSNRDCRDNQDRAEVDVFFIHPTTYFGVKNWNQSIGDPRSDEWVDEMVMPGQASVFNECARIFAPRYRQATLYSFMDPGSDGRQALAFAYQDVARAFRHYLDHANDGRPFLIASHSQGSCHGIRLLEEEIDRAQCRDRFIAAYLGGYRIPLDKFGKTLSTIRPNDRADDVGVAMGWDTIYDGFESFAQDSAAGHYYATGWERAHGKEKLTTNPLSWRRDDDDVDSSQHLGALRIKADNVDMSKYLSTEPMGVVTRELFVMDQVKISARNRNSSLCVREDEGDRTKMLAGPIGNLHNFDYSLCYMNIRENAARRVRAFLKGS